MKQLHLHQRGERGPYAFFGVDCKQIKRRRFLLVSMNHVDGEIPFRGPLGDLACI